MRYLVIGSGGREHVISWRLLQDGSAREVYVAPGNGGIDPAFCAQIAGNDFEAVAKFCVEKKIDMVVVGPEVPLVNGIVDYLESQRIPVFGPTKKAAMLEGSKIFAKQIMQKYNIPTARHQEFEGKKELLKYVEREENFPLVLKLDGLAAGKGVSIPETRKDATEFIQNTVKDDTRVFVEEFIAGQEASVLCVSDGTHIAPLVAAQDHKRIYDGDKGPNTGGMGAYAPAPIVTEDLLSEVQKKILQPAVDGMRKEGIPFKGILYAGLMINDRGVKVLEFNARFGDPESQVILPLLNGKLGDLFQGAVSGALNKAEVSFKKMHAITVVIASGGYPGQYPKGEVISGLDRINGEIIIFHAGTTIKDGACYTNGGRVLNVTALGSTLREARDKVYEVIDLVKFKGAFYRKDIGHRAL